MTFQSAKLINSDAQVSIGAAPASASVPAAGSTTSVGSWTRHRYALVSATGVVAAIASGGLLTGLCILALTMAVLAVMIGQAIHHS